MTYLVYVHIYLFVVCSFIQILVYYLVCNVSERFRLASNLEGEFSLDIKGYTTVFTY